VKRKKKNPMNMPPDQQRIKETQPLSRLANGGDDGDWLREATSTEGLNKFVGGRQVLYLEAPSNIRGRLVAGRRLESQSEAVRLNSFELYKQECDLVTGIRKQFTDGNLLRNAEATYVRKLETLVGSRSTPALRVPVPMDLLETRRARRRREERRERRTDAGFIGAEPGRPSAGPPKGGADGRPRTSSKGASDGQATEEAPAYVTEGALAYDAVSYGIGSSAASTI
jgi:hypothetical protein